MNDDPIVRLGPKFNEMREESLQDANYELVSSTRITHKNGNCIELDDDEIQAVLTNIHVALNNYSNEKVKIELNIYQPIKTKQRTVYI